MATLASRSFAPSTGDERFFLRAAIAMAIVVVAGFSLNLAMGRSTFHSPPLVHAHAITFMGWLVIYLLQNLFAATGRMDLHRPLGWIATIWVVAMIVLGFLATIAVVRRADVPFVFMPLQFLVFDLVIVLTFAGLTWAAVIMRRHTDWHRRLHYCGMATLMGPAYGRLLPMIFLMPWAYETMFAACLIFPAVGVWSDLRRNGRVHPAWRWGIATMIGSLLLTEALTYSRLGAGLYRAVTNGSPGAQTPPVQFAPLPPGL